MGSSCIGMFCAYFLTVVLHVPVMGARIKMMFISDHSFKQRCIRTICSVDRSEMMQGRIV